MNKEDAALRLADMIENCANDFVANEVTVIIALSLVIGRRVAGLAADHAGASAGVGHAATLMGKCAALSMVEKLASIDFA